MVLARTFNSFEKSPAYRKWSRAASSGAGFPPRHQAGCWICGCSWFERGPAPAPPSSSALMSAEHLCTIFLSGTSKPILQAKVPPAFRGATAQIAVLHGAIWCHPIRLFYTGAQTKMPGQPVHKDLPHASAASLGLCTSLARHVFE